MCVFRFSPHYVTLRISPRWETLWGINWCVWWLTSTRTWRPALPSSSSSCVKRAVRLTVTVFIHLTLYRRCQRFDPVCVCVFQCPGSLSTRVTGTPQACWRLEVWCGEAGSRGITLRMRTATRRSTERPSHSECVQAQCHITSTVCVFERDKECVYVCVILALILWRVEWKKSSRTRWREWRRSRRSMRPWSWSACSINSPGEHRLPVLLFFINFHSMMDFISEHYIKFATKITTLLLLLYYFTLTFFILMIPHLAWQQLNISQFCVEPLARSAPPSPWTCQEPVKNPFLLSVWLLDLREFLWINVNY